MNIYLTMATKDDDVATRPETLIQYLYEVAAASDLLLAERKMPPGPLKPKDSTITRI